MLTAQVVVRLDPGLHYALKVARFDDAMPLAPDSADGGCAALMRRATTQWDATCPEPPVVEVAWHFPCRRRTRRLCGCVTATGHRSPGGNSTAESGP